MADGADLGDVENLILNFSESLKVTKQQRSPS